MIFIQPQAFPAQTHCSISRLVSDIKWLRIMGRLALRSGSTIAKEAQAEAWLLLVENLSQYPAWTTSGRPRNFWRPLRWLCNINNNKCNID